MISVLPKNGSNARFKIFTSSQQNINGKLNLSQESIDFDGKKIHILRKKNGDVIVDKTLTVQDINNYLISLGKNLHLTKDIFLQAQEQLINEYNNQDFSEEDTDLKQEFLDEKSSQDDTENIGDFKIDEEKIDNIDKNLQNPDSILTDEGTSNENKPPIILKISPIDKDTNSSQWDKIREILLKNNSSSISTENDDTSLKEKLSLDKPLIYYGSKEENSSKDETSSEDTSISIDKPNLDDMIKILKDKITNDDNKKILPDDTQIKELTQQADDKSDNIDTKIDIKNEKAGIEDEEKDTPVEEKDTPVEEKDIEDTKEDIESEKNAKSVSTDVIKLFQ